MSERERRIEAAYAAYAADPSTARRWSGENPGNRAIRAELAAALFDALPMLRGGEGDVLDAGCGTGWWLEHMLAKGVRPQRLHGVDLLGHRVAAARARAPGVTVVRGDLTSLPYEDDRFAAVTMLTVLSSMDPRAQRAALAEATRVAEPGAPIAVWDLRRPNPRNPHTHPVHLPTRSRADRQTITLFPQIARRLGRFTAIAYPALAAVPVLRSHQLVLLRSE